MRKKVIIVGAGPAGIGVGVVLKKMKVPFVILERDSVGSSFKQWPEEMRFISPSFTGNFFGMPDLNAITPSSSPGYTLQTEHPNGKEYAYYLNAIAEHYKLPIEENCDVLSVQKKGKRFSLETSQGTWTSDVVIWAAGEFQYPHDYPFEGAEECIHNSEIRSWKKLKGDSFVVVGAYESGVDAAYQLAKLGKKVRLIDSDDQIANKESDSSYSLSPFTKDRYFEYRSKISVTSHTKVVSVTKQKDVYNIVLSNGKRMRSKTAPILATGFVSSLSLVEDLFVSEDGYVGLTENDESKKTAGLFLVGPQVRHGGAIFCFIYKYRQRFAIVAETIARRLGKNVKADEVVAEYKEMNFYLKDLSRCGDDCVC